MNNIIRVEHTKHYTCIANDAIRDKRLSLKARGLHHLLLSYPDNWRVSIEHLSEEASDKDKRTAIQEALKELEKFGYLAREKARDNKGRMCGWQYVIRELPQADFPTMEKSAHGKNRRRKKPSSENPEAENPATVFPSSENQPLINTDSYEVSKYEVTIPPISPQGEEEGEGVNAVKPEEKDRSCEVLVLDQPNQHAAKQTSQPIQGTTSSAAPRDNNKRYVRNQPQYPKNIDGSDRLPWETKKQGLFEEGFERRICKSLSLFSSYKSLPDGDLITQARKHISGGKYDLKRRDELLIEWDAYQSELLRAAAPTHQVQAAPDTMHQPRKPIKLAGKR